MNEVYMKHNKLFDNMASGTLESENVSGSFQITPISKPGKTISLLGVQVALFSQ